MRRPSLVLLLLLLGSVPEPAARGEVPPLQPPGKGSGADLGSIGTPRIHPFDPHRFEMAGESWFPLGFYGGSMAMTATTGPSSTRPPTAGRRMPSTTSSPPWEERD